MNMICLIIWVSILLLYLIDLKNKKDINPVITICAILVCIMHYINNIFG